MTGPDARRDGLGRPAGHSAFGVTAWRIPGQPGAHLTWGGPGDRLHICTGGRDDGGYITLGPERWQVAEAGRLLTLADAQSAADSWWRAQPARDELAEAITGGGDDDRK